MCIARDDAPKRMDLFLDTAARFPQYAFVWVGNGRDYDKPDNAVLLGRIPMADRLLDQSRPVHALFRLRGTPHVDHRGLVARQARRSLGRRRYRRTARRHQRPCRGKPPEAFAEKIEAIFADNGRYETMSHAAHSHTSGRSPSTAWRTDIGKYTIGSIGNNNMNITHSSEAPDSSEPAYWGCSASSPKNTRCATSTSGKATSSPRDAAGRRARCGGAARKKSQDRTSWCCWLPNTATTCRPCRSTTT